MPLCQITTGGAQQEISLSAQSLRNDMDASKLDALKRWKKNMR